MKEHAVERMEFILAQNHNTERKLSKVTAAATAYLGAVDKNQDIYAARAKLNEAISDSWEAFNN